MITPWPSSQTFCSLEQSGRALPLNLPVVLQSSGKTLCGLQLNPVTRLDGVQIQFCNLGHWSREAVWVWWWCMLWYSPPPQPPPHTSSTNCSQSQEHFQLGVFHLANPDPHPNSDPAQDLEVHGVLILRHFISIFFKYGLIWRGEARPEHAALRAWVWLASFPAFYHLTRWRLGLVKLLRRMTSGGRLEAWHFRWTAVLYMHEQSTNHIPL